MTDRDRPDRVADGPIGVKQDSDPRASADDRFG
jgi:hypothetical protein